jgi:uroporphyrinogen decarboxylase
MSMTPRERVLKAINHEEPDRIPIDFGTACCWSIVDAPNMPEHAYLNLCKYLGIKDPVKPIRGALMNEVDNVDERVLQRFGVDTRYSMPGGHPLEEVDNEAMRGPLGIRFKPVGHYNDPDKFPMRDFATVEEIKNYPFWPDPDDPIYTEGLENRFKAIYENTDYAIGLELVFWGVVSDAQSLLFGLDKWLMNMKLRPELYHGWMKKYFETTDKIVARVLTAVRNYIDLVVIYNDLGTQERLFMSHKDYVESFKPYEGQLIQRVKEHCDAKVIMHSCGSTSSVIKDRAELRLDVINPIQPLAANMDAEYLKKNFGDIICFHGGIDIQRLLPFGTPKTIREEIKRLISILGPGGGWIAAPSHNIEPETPPENIVAMFDALQEFGTYPIRA